MTSAIILIVIVTIVTIIIIIIIIIINNNIIYLVYYLQDAGSPRPVGITAAKYPWRHQVDVVRRGHRRNPTANHTLICQRFRIRTLGTRKITVGIRIDGMQAVHGATPKIQTSDGNIVVYLIVVRNKTIMYWNS